MHLRNVEGEPTCRHSLRTPHIPKLVSKESSTSPQIALKALVNGEVELGLQQISELRLEAGIVIAGPLPEDLQKASVVSAAVPSKAVSMEAAKQFYAFLLTPFAAEAMKKSGVDLPGDIP